ncbi:histone deacetylase family protein [bacterium]|nr:histone deacetylase family protein [bacterium]
MFRIRRIYDDALPVNRAAIGQVQEILKGQFPLLSDKEIRKLPDILRNPMKHGFKAVLLVTEDGRGRVKGFALIYHESALKFCYLDFISASLRMTGRGIGGALYERARQEAFALGTVGLFFECLPDDPALCVDPEICRQNRTRLRFYERFGAFPITGTKYETPVQPGDDNPPLLVYDPAGYAHPLRKSHARKIVRAILERKYGDLCPASYIDMVVQSFQDDPVRVRQPRYYKHQLPMPVRAEISEDSKILLVVSEGHEDHHIHERGYVEAPVRVDAILKGIEPTGLFRRIRTGKFSETHIRAVHNPGFVEYLRRVCRNIEPGQTIYPYVFPLRNQTRPPVDLPIRAGYYCMDTFTPIHRDSFRAAKRAVDCALTGARALLEGNPIAYALVRPPGHHAEKAAFGGFCYFNSNAVAAHYLSAHGRVAILDVDYHHGNGQEDIFYERADVLTVSIHGHPKFAFPYFTGFADSRGLGYGEKYNLNFPSPEILDGPGYRLVLERALKRIRRFNPAFLIVALGLDTSQGDPTGSWSLKALDFELNGRMIGMLGRPILVIQEGGYNTRKLGSNARAFFSGLWKGVSGLAHFEKSSE